MDFKQMDAWKQAMLLVKCIYELAKGFPKEELYGLSSQIRRAAVSIPSNIAEGIGRNYKKDTIQFLHIARGSIYELETLVEIATMLKMGDPQKLIEASGLMSRSSQLINGLIRYYEKTDIK